MNSVRPLHHAAIATATAGLVVLALAGCGSSAGSTATPTPAASARGGGGAPGQPAGGGRAPGIAGTVAAVDGRTLQVQGANEQTAVVYTPKTKVTAQVATSAAALAVGNCVSVRPVTSTSTAPTGSTAPGASTGPLAAASVTILSTKGGCEAGAGFPGGGFPGGGRPVGAGVPSGMPSGAPSGPPSGMPAGGRPGGSGRFGAIGEVTALSAGSFTVASVLPRFGGPGSAGGATPTPTASASPAPVTVTYAAATTFLTTAEAKASSVKVGSCVRATGTTDDTGTLTATTLVLSSPVDGSCTFGVRGG